MDDRIAKEFELMMTLKSIPMFNELALETIYEISKITTYKNAASGEAVVKRGEVGHTFFVILDGQVAVYLAEESEPITCLGPGELFGELGIIDRLERTATVKALEGVLMLEFDGDGFLDLLVKNGTIAFSVAKTYSQRLRSMLEM